MKPWRPPSVRGSRGLTVVELVVALLLLSVGLVTLAAAMPPALHAVVAGGRQATATLLAQQAIEQVRTGSPETLCTLDTGGGFAPVTGHTGFLRRIEVRPLATSCPGWPGADTLATVTVTVRVGGAEGVGSSGPRDTTLVALRSR